MLDGALPAIDGSSLTGVGVDGITSSADATAMTITSAEKVGVGITNPNSTFVVSDGGAYGMEFYPNDSSVSKILAYDRSGSAYRDFKISGNQIILGYGTSGANEALRINADGIVTMPKQPCFLASNNGVQANVTGNGATHTINWGTETFDLNADFDGTTFTAPVTGKYLISASLHFQQLTAAADQVQLGIVTSNKAFTSVIYHQNGWGSEPESHKTVLCDMDAADTFTITCRISGESSDIVDVTAGANGYTYVSCALIA